MANILACQMSPHDMFSGQFIEWEEQSKKAKVAAGVITQVRLGNDHQHQVNDQEWQKYHSGLSRIGEGVGDEDEDEGDHQLKEEGGEGARTWRTWTMMNWQISENLNQTKFFVTGIVLLLQGAISSCFAHHLHRHFSRCLFQPIWVFQDGFSKVTFQRMRRRNQKIFSKFQN